VASGGVVLTMLRLRWAVALAVLGTAGLVSGCVSIKSQTAVQRAPGVVELRGVVCASDYDSSHSATCRQSNIAERDNGTGEAELTGLGQLLVGFRVPVGTIAPADFPSDAQDVNFDASPTYTSALEAMFPPGPNERWVGYISTAKSFDPDVPADRATGFRPEFGLPPQPGGVPFEGPFPWRLAVGFRELDNVGQAGTPVRCQGNHKCADAPRNNPPNFPANLRSPVSDFGLAAPAGATARAGEAAALAFSLGYSDGRGLGAQDVTLSATTDVPATSATPTTPRMEPGTSTVDVSVPVPAGTPPGSYTVTLKAAVGSPPVERSSTALLVVAPAPLPAPPADRDGDGLADPSDRCPDTPRGAFDADGNGCVGPYRRVSLTPSGGWDVGDRGLTIGTMRLKGLPRGARVELRCGVCRVRQTLTATRSELNLKRLRGKTLRRGTGFIVKVTSAGRIGQELRLTLRRYGNTRSEFRRIARRPFETRKRCVPVGDTRTAASCTPTPPTGP
jgi:hypothetical protein